MVMFGIGEVEDSWYEVARHVDFGIVEVLQIVCVD